MSERVSSSAMRDEFDVVPRWTQEAVKQLGSAHAIPAACRGSASPAALRWLARGLAPGTLLLDVGGGMGGPAAFAATEAGLRPVVVDPMPGACGAAAGLFGLLAVVAAGERLPFAAGSAEAVWCLGVLCTVDAKAQLLAELHRVLAPGGLLGLLVFVRHGNVSGGPDGNSFPTEDELGGALRTARFTVADRADLADVGGPPEAWQVRIAEVDRVIEERHDTDPRHAEALDQERRIGRLISRGSVAGLLLRAVAE